MVELVAEEALLRNVLYRESAVPYQMCDVILYKYVKKESYAERVRHVSPNRIFSKEDENMKILENSINVLDFS
jgi:hypothetical protein